MKITFPSVKKLTKATGGKKRKVCKKTNQWFYCPRCMILCCFRVFKCRFNLDAAIECECGCTLRKAPNDLCREAKIIFPHFRFKKQRGDKTGEDWYYGVYLRSEAWKEIRLRILLRDEETCQRCGGIADIVHHKSYDDDVIA